MTNPEPLDYGQQRPKKWVTVASFSHAAMANVAKLQLDAEEIPNYIDNEHAATMLWYIQPAVGGVRLKVPEEFEEEAHEVLQNQEPDGDGAEEDAYNYGDEQIDYADTTRCPSCHSTDTEPLSWGWRLVHALIILIIGGMIHPLVLILLVGYVIWFLFTKPSHWCLRCRHRFSASATGN